MGAGPGFSFRRWLLLVGEPSALLEPDEPSELCELTEGRCWPPGMGRRQPRIPQEDIDDNI